MFKRFRKLEARILLSADLFGGEYADPSEEHAEWHEDWHDDPMYPEDIGEKRSPRSNLPPYVASPISSPPSVRVGDRFEFSVPSETFVDPEGGNLTYWSFPWQHPSWMNMDQTTGRFFGTPTDSNHVGTFPVTVSVTDPIGAGTTTVFQITVRDNIAPTASPIPPKTTSQFSPVSFSVASHFSDTDGDKLTYWSFPWQKPSWMNFDQSSGRFYGTPTDQAHVGTFPVTVSATDTIGAGTTTFFHITINDTNEKPYATKTIPTQTAAQHSSFSYQLPSGLFVDPDGDSLRLSSSGNPSWLAFDGSRFSGTPSAESDCTTYTISVNANDGRGLSANQSLSLSVININDPPYVAGSVPDTSAEQYEAFEFSVPVGTFQDPEGDSLTYWSFLWQHPSWMSMDQTTGRFFGTPTDDSHVGTFTVTVSATDHSGKGTTTTFGVTVSGKPATPPEIRNLEGDRIEYDLENPGTVYIDSGQDVSIIDNDSYFRAGGFLELEIIGAHEEDILILPSEELGIPEWQIENSHVVIKFTDNVSIIDTQNFIQNIRFDNTLAHLPNPPFEIYGDRKIRLIINDGRNGEYEITF